MTSASPTWARIFVDLLLDHRRGRPALLAADDLAQEALEHLGAVRGVDDLGVELDAVEAALGRLEGGDRRAGACREGIEALGRLHHGVAVAHPALLLFGKVAKELAAVAGEGQRRAAELAGLGAFDLAAELERHRLHAVTDAEHRDAELEQLGPHARRALGVDRRGAAREDERARRAVADALERDVRRQELGEDAALADPPGDQLRVLPAVVEDEDLLARRLRRLDVDRLGGGGLALDDLAGRGRGSRNLGCPVRAHLAVRRRGDARSGISHRRP